MRKQIGSAEIDGQRPSSATGDRPRGMIEALESRTFLSASLKIENLDVIPGFERLIFSRVGTVNANFPNYNKERGTLKLSNVGDQTLKISSLKISGPFRILGLVPQVIQPGKFVKVTVQFTAFKTPPFTFNQTAGFDNQQGGGTWSGALTFKTNDPDTSFNHANVSEALAGWYQKVSEADAEPSLQTIVNLIMDYKTVIAPGTVPHLDEPVDSAQYYGDEVQSAYWQSVDPAKTVGVRQIAMYHTQGNTSSVNWYDKSTQSAKNIFVADGLAGQTFLPYKQGQKGTAAAGNFLAGTKTFGFKIDTEWSDDKLNTKRPTGGGHHVRFYPVKDHLGNTIANLYFMVMDYSIVSVGQAQNYDFQDNIYLISNVKPAGN